MTIYQLNAMDHAIATGDIDTIRKLWPAIKTSINLKADYATPARPINQE